MHLDMEFIRNKSNLVEIHRTPFYTGVKKYVSAYMKYSLNRDTPMHRYMTILRSLITAVIGFLRFTHDSNTQNSRDLLDDIGRFIQGC